MNPEDKTSPVGNAFNDLPKTGTAMFQFDDEAPSEIGPIYGDGGLTLHIPRDGGDIIFQHNSKSFRLFIKKED